MITKVLTPFSNKITNRWINTCVLCYKHLHAWIPPFNETVLRLVHFYRFLWFINCFSKELFH